MLISFESFARATAGSRVSGHWAHMWRNGGRPAPPPFPMLPALDVRFDSCHFVLHRHRPGARKVRRILRRAQQASFAAWASREGQETTSLRDFMRPRGWLGKNWRWT